MEWGASSCSGAGGWWVGGWEESSAHTLPPHPNTCCWFFPIPSSCTPLPSRFCLPTAPGCRTIPFEPQGGLGDTCVAPTVPWPALNFVRAGRDRPGKEQDHLLLDFLMLSQSHLPAQVLGLIHSLGFIFLAKLVRGCCLHRHVEGVPLAPHASAAAGPADSLLSALWRGWVHAGEEGAA